MKTTIKLEQGRSLIVEPVQGQGVRMTLNVYSIPVGSMVLQADAVGAALEALDSCAREAGLAS